MEIKIEVAGARLDKALADLTPLSRAVANEQIKEGKVLVNGAVKKAKYTVKEGDIISMRGRGRMKVEAITGTSRKGRIGVYLKRFM